MGFSGSNLLGNEIAFQKCLVFADKRRTSRLFNFYRISNIKTSSKNISIRLLKFRLKVTNIETATGGNSFLKLFRKKSSQRREIRLQVH